MDAPRTSPAHDATLAAQYRDAAASAVAAAARSQREHRPSIARAFRTVVSNNLALLTREVGPLPWSPARSAALAACRGAR